MDFIKQYLKVVSYMCSGLVFVFASFYLLANVFHYMELRRDYVAKYDDQVIVTEIDSNIQKATENVSSFDVNNYNGTIPAAQMSLIKQNIDQCAVAFNNETRQAMKGKTKITIVDVYKLRESYENDILNKCIINNLYWITSVEDNYPSATLVKNKEINKLYVDSLLSSTSYLKKDLLNNSSYYYNTSIASSSMKDNTRDGFFEVMDSYNKAAKFVLYISNWFKEEAGV